jgi:negative regulator of sigma-B (phosphoserine phosphatase)
MGAAWADGAVTPHLEWAARLRPVVGEIECGDAYVVANLPEGMLLGAVDGLGHGPEAASASSIACATLDQHATEPPIELVKRCHAALYKTRGAALSIANIDAAHNAMTWLGVGNVEGMLLRADQRTRPARESLSLRGGVVGYQIPPLRTAVLPLNVADILVFFSDGIDGRFHQEMSFADTVDLIAERILLRHAKASDDALVLVARYLGTPS